MNQEVFPDTRRIKIAGGLITAIATLLFFSLYWNRFLGLRSGAGSFAGGAGVLAGLLPYRDYFTASTPLNSLKSAAVLQIFGNQMIVLRAFDVLERVGLGLLVYCWLSRLFSTRDAVLASVVTIVASASDISDPISSYNHDAIFCAVASGLAGSFLLDRDRSANASMLLSLLCGFLAGLSFATKQTIGLGATAGIGFVCAACILRAGSIRRAGIFLLLYVTGWCVAAGALLLWLAQLGVVSVFIEQAFVKGPAAKASHPIDFLIRFVFVAKRMALAVVPALIALFICFRSWRDREIRYVATSSGDLGWVALIAVSSIGLGWAVSYTGVPAAVFRALAGKPPIFFTLFSVIALLAFYSFSLVRRPLSWREEQYFLFAMVSFAVAFMLSLSWPAFEAMTVPGLGLLVAATLRGSKKWIRCGICASAAFVIVGETAARVDVPFGFSDLNEPPVRMAQFQSSLPELRGFRLPESTVRFVDETVNIVRNHSAPDDTIFTYPEMGIFYPLTNRRAPTDTTSHNIDVVNDEFARSEARKLLVAPPAVIIYYRQPEAYLSDQEAIWRNGQRSGQRDLIAAIESLVKTYHLAQTFVMPTSGRDIEVYVKR